jgi:hypothetical protein
MRSCKGATTKAKAALNKRMPYFEVDDVEYAPRLMKAFATPSNYVEARPDCGEHREVAGGHLAVR